MNTNIFCFFLLVCGTLPMVYSTGYSKVSAKSGVFEPVRPKHPPKSISECDTVVTEPYGVLEKTYKRGQVKEGASCSWTLRAPANHVVNVISVAFDLLDDISPEKHAVSSGSLLGLYDGADSSKLLTEFTVSLYQLSGSGFVQSISSKEEMLVKITYRDNIDYATQKIAVNPSYATQKVLIKYEFLNVDDMNRLLQTGNVKPKTT